MVEKSFEKTDVWVKISLKYGIFNAFLHVFKKKPLDIKNLRKSDFKPLWAHISMTKNTSKTDGFHQDPYKSGKKGFTGGHSQKR